MFQSKKQTKSLVINHKKINTYELAEKECRTILKALNELKENIATTQSQKNYA